MKIISTYKTKILHYNNIFSASVKAYQKAVDYFITVCLENWTYLSAISTNKKKQGAVEKLTIPTKSNPEPRYCFPEKDKQFQKFPSYLRRAAITEAIGKVSSYKSNLANWENEVPAAKGKRPSMPKAGNIYPVLYKGNMYKQSGPYEFNIKVWIRNTWDWLTVNVRKSDMDYINKHCKTRKQLSPKLQKRYRNWYLDFCFEEAAVLNDTPIAEKVAVAVDLGINNACTCSIMYSDGTVAGRHFLKLPAEEDSLNHAINRIKKAQQHGARKMPRLWGKAKGINQDISVKTANFIMDTATLYSADVIVFEALDTSGKKKGSKKQRLHHWKAKTVQAMVADKAHRFRIRISHVCAWGTSRLAYDGSGRVLRGEDADLPSYSVCRFQTGKVYNCDLSASYNIGARYFIRELLKSLPEKVKLEVLAKVPELSKRTTCTLSSLIGMHAVLCS